MRGVSVQRNSGVIKGKGKYLLFLDADNYLKPDFLKRLSDEIENNKADVFTCYIENDLSTKTERITANIINLYIQIMYWVKSPGALGACIGCRRDIFCKQNVFREDLVIFEDGFFVRNLSRLGYKCIIFRDIKFGYSLRRFQRHGYLKTFLNYIWLIIKHKIFNLDVVYEMGGREPAK